MGRHRKPLTCLGNESLQLTISVQYFLPRAKALSSTYRFLWRCSFWVTEPPELWWRHLNPDIKALLGLFVFDERHFLQPLISFFSARKSNIQNTEWLTPFVWLTAWQTTLPTPHMDASSEILPISHTTERLRVCFSERKALQMSLVDVWQEDLSSISSVEIFGTLCLNCSTLYNAKIRFLGKASSASAGSTQNRIKPEWKCSFQSPAHPGGLLFAINPSFLYSSILDAFVRSYSLATPFFMT